MRRIGLAAILLLPLLAAASETVPTVAQAERRFSESRLVIERAGKVRFVNDDSVRHNIAVQTPAGEDETGIVQEPGTETVLSFTEAGQYRIHCLIHPRMKMTVVAQ